MHRLYKPISFHDTSRYTITLQLPPMVLADSAFGLEAWQMTPFKSDNGAVSKKQRRFNWIHSSARVVVEHAFGRLKGRFRLLLGTHRTSWQLGAHAVMAAMVLHNFLGLQNDDFLADWAEGVEELESSGEGTKRPIGSVVTEQLQGAMMFKDGVTSSCDTDGRCARTGTGEDTALSK
eukprot:scaffold1_cov375-Pavlova_lutheri.AAC.46